MSKKPLKRDELKRRMKKKKRKEGSRLAQPERYLIICEGKRQSLIILKVLKKELKKSMTSELMKELMLQVIQP